MSTRDILISGASIAGPALALALVRRGFRPVVVERAPALREGGYKIDVRGAAIDVVKRLGVHAAVRQASTDVQGGTFVDGAGRRLVSLDGATIGFRSGEDVELLRGDLARILFERSRDQVEYRFGHSIASLRDDGHGVEVTFEHGAAQRFDLVIGADGLHSQVRSLAFPDAGGCERALGNFIAICSVPNDFQLDRWELIHRAPGRIVQVYSTRGDAAAEVLASELAAAGGDHARGLPAYEARMRPFVARNQALGRDVARQQVQTGRAQIWLQTQMMRLLAYLPWKERVMAGFVEKVSGAANAIALQPEA